MFKLKSAGSSSRSMFKFKPLKMLLSRKKKKSTSIDKEDPTTSSSESSNHGYILTRSRSETPPTPTSETQSWKTDLVRAFLKKWNQHDMDGAREMVTNDFAIGFAAADNMEMDYDEYAAEAKKIYDAFPDFHFCYDSIEERKNDGVVVLHNLIVKNVTTQLHAFGQPASLLSGTRHDTIPETLYFHFEDGKICKQIVATEEDETKGSLGSYTEMFLCFSLPVDLASALSSM
ncbi:unknown protein [Seminavis robusta]|uniref:SnoaL-like domain-containing protein n=1 Tax=Seminavis robusta TaxID=568900 RepID=A0A9N8EQQ8_9STRA|nr:unknown protein [Seminavis robusta]|eukprot:Sro1804_g298720.1 n/a (231) ;mRNA; f:21449-22141